MRPRCHSHHSTVHQRGQHVALGKQLATAMQPTGPLTWRDRRRPPPNTLRQLRLHAGPHERSPFPMTRTRSAPTTCRRMRCIMTMGPHQIPSRQTTRTRTRTRSEREVDGDDDFVAADERQPSAPSATAKRSSQRRMPAEPASGGSSHRKMRMRRAARRAARRAVVTTTSWKTPHRHRSVRRPNASPTGRQRASARSPPASSAQPAAAAAEEEEEAARRRSRGSPTC